MQAGKILDRVPSEVESEKRGTVTAVGLDSQAVTRAAYLVDHRLLVATLSRPREA
ncbi:MAG: hypothetical protein M3322_12740 [Actinomycetota bacterium]|nr:hypothetical protein [Actinomycetota bacterium]